MLGCIDSEATNSSVESSASSSLGSGFEAQGSGFKVRLCQQRASGKSIGVIFYLTA